MEITHINTVLEKHGIIQNDRPLSDREEHLIILYGAMKDIGFGNLSLLDRDRLQELKEIFSNLSYLKRFDENERAEILAGLNNPTQLDHTLHERLLTGISKEISSIKEKGPLSKDFLRKERQLTIFERVNIFNANIKIDKLRREIEMLENTGENMDTPKEQLNELEKYINNYETTINNLTDQNAVKEFDDAVITPISGPGIRNSAAAQNIAAQPEMSSPVNNAETVNDTETAVENAEIADNAAAAGNEQETANLTAIKKLQMNALLNEFESMEAQDKARYYPNQKIQYMEDSGVYIEQGANITQTISDCESGEITGEDAEQKLNELQTAQSEGLDSPALYGEWGSRKDKDRNDVYIQIAARITTILDNMLRRKKQAKQKGDKCEAHEDPYEKFSSRFFNGDPESTRRFHLLAAQYCRNSTPYLPSNTVNGTSVDRRALFRDMLNDMAGISQQSFRTYLSQSEHNISPEQSMDNNI